MLGLLVPMIASMGAGADDEVTSAVDLVSGAGIESIFSPGYAAGVLQDETGGDPGEIPDLNPLPSRFGTKGTWRFHVHGGGGVDIDGTDQILFVGGVAYSYFVVDDLSIDFEFNALYFDQPGPDAIGGNFNALFRWHYLTDVNWSLYLEAGAGVLGTSEEAPRGGSNFNFTPQAGFGVSFDVAEQTRMLIGARWHHVSNASLYSENPGQDAILGYVALSFPF